MRFTFILLTCLALIFVSCKKECRNKKIKNVEAEEGEAVLTDGRFYSHPGTTFADSIGSPAHFIITDSTGYELTFKNTKPFGTLDFRSHMIVGIRKSTNKTSTIQQNQNIFVNDSQLKLKLKVNYVLSDQCKGSGIHSYPLNVFAIIPIRYKNYQIYFDVVDLNPYGN